MVATEEGVAKLSFFLNEVVKLAQFPNGIAACMPKGRSLYLIAAALNIENYKASF